MADPLVHDRIAPRLVRFIVDGGRVRARSRGALEACRRCCCMPAATAASSPAGAAAFAAAAPRDVVTTPRVSARCIHEIFNEREQGEVFAVLRDWLAARAPDATAPRASAAL